MKLLTQKQIDTMLAEAKSAGYREGFKEGEHVGYSRGLVEDKSGVVFCRNGMYVFNSDNFKGVKTGG